MQKYKHEHKFEHVYEDENGVAQSVTVTTNEICLDDVVRKFEDYLKGCGFSSELVLEVKYGDE